MQPDVHWHASTTPAADALSAHARLLGVRARSCRDGCARPAGAMPTVDPGYATEPELPYVSLSRSGPHLVTVIADRPVGVDVEAAAIDVHPALVLALGEKGDLARAWVRKEAVLKLRGTGLSTPMSEVVLADESWRDLPSPEGYVAAVAPGE